MLTRDEVIFQAGKSSVLECDAQRDGWRRHEGEILRLSRQPLPPDPLQSVRALIPFTVAGRVPAVGEVVELAASDGRTMIALGRAEPV